MVAPCIHKNSIYAIYSMATPCEWILNTVPKTVWSTEDPVTIVTLFVLLFYRARHKNNPPRKIKYLRKDVT